MNQASETAFPLKTRTKLSLLFAVCLALGFALGVLFTPSRPLPGPKPRPTDTPTRQEPSRRPNTSLEPELVCGQPGARPTGARPA